MSVYSSFYERVLLPGHNLIRGRQYYRYRNFLEESQWWTRDKLLDFQWRELRSLLGHVFTSVPYYRYKYAKAGIALEDIRSWGDFSALPPLTRSEVNEHREELRSTCYTGKIEPYATGGSSGVPTRFYITGETYDWRHATSQRVYSWTGCRLGERTLYLWGAPIGRVSRLQSLKKQAHQFLQRQLIVSTFSQTPEMWQGIYNRACHFRPKLLIGYVSSLEECARFLLGRGLTLPGIKAVIAAAEPVYASTRELIAMAFRAPLFNTYGSREFMSIGGECSEHKGLHINMENVVVQTWGASEPSDLLVTDLHNYGMPFVRYLIGDLGRLDESPCACGRGLPRLASVDGRTLDALRTRSGRVVPGEWFPHLLKEIPEIQEYQVRQTSLDEIVIAAVLSSSLGPKSEALLETEIKKVFGDSARITLDRVDQIPRLPSGKRRVTIGLAS